jgi:micrococcal nuclease
MRPTLAGLLMVLHLASPRPALADEFRGKVVGVADGDTITVLRDKTPVKIRLQAVDCPEKAQPFGEKAKQFTSNMVFGKVVTVKVATKDKYGRTVAWVSVGGKTLNEELLRAGLAWHYKHYDKSEKLATLEREAKAAKRGLWADANPTAPWEWRHSKKGQSKAGADAARASPTGVFHGNTKSKVFHRAGCKGYDCKHCTKTFPSVEAAVKAGYRAHNGCVDKTKAGSSRRWDLDGCETNPAAFAAQ